MQGEDYGEDYFLYPADGAEEEEEGLEGVADYGYDYGAGGQVQNTFNILPMTVQNILFRYQQTKAFLTTERLWRRGNSTATILWEKEEKQMQEGWWKEGEEICPNRRLRPRRPIRARRTLGEARRRIPLEGRKLLKIPLKMPKITTRYYKTAIIANVTTLAMWVHTFSFQKVDEAPENVDAVGGSDLSATEPMTAATTTEQGTYVD